jgi:hypothetical protein
MSRLQSIGDETSDKNIFSKLLKIGRDFIYGKLKKE